MKYHLVHTNPIKAHLCCICCFNMQALNKTYFYLILIRNSISNHLVSSYWLSIVNKICPINFKKNYINDFVNQI